MTRTRTVLLLLWTVALLSLVVAGCGNHEKKMIKRVDALLEAHQHRQALDYLERYLTSHVQSYKAWEYKVLIRLELDQRAAAGAEYWRLQTAMERQHPEVLERVVLNRGAGWIVDDYLPLARCGTDTLADVAFFDGVLEGEPSTPGSNVYITPRAEVVIGVMDALPGRFAAAAAPLIIRGQQHDVEEVRLAAAGAAVRLAVLDANTGDALLRTSLEDRAATVRRGTLVAMVGEDGLQNLGRYGISANEGNPSVAVAWLGLSGRMGEERALEVRTAAAAVDPTVAALVAPESVDSNAFPMQTLAARFADGTLDGATWTRAAEGDKRSLIELVAPVLPPPPALVEALTTDGDRIVRITMASYLTSGVTHEPLLALLSDEEVGVRLAAARALASSGDAAALEPLQSFFDGGSFEEKLAILDAMSYRADTPFLPIAMKAQADALPLVRETAIKPLAASCSDENRARMLDALTDDEPHVVVRAATSLYITLLNMPPETWINPKPKPEPAEGAEQPAEGAEQPADPTEQPQDPPATVQGS